MFSVKAYQDQLLTTEDAKQQPAHANQETIVVLKQYRFHKQLSVGLYAASMTGKGRIKNPVTEIELSEISMAATDADALRFYSAVSRFQNNPTAPRKSSDFDALKQVFHNPLQLRFFRHDSAKSENVTATSLNEVKPAASKADLFLNVYQRGTHYEIIPGMGINHKQYLLTQVDFRFDYFVQVKNDLYLLAGFHLMKLCHFFRYQQPVIQVPANDFHQFKTAVLDKLEERVVIKYHNLKTGTPKQIQEANLAGQPEKLIYLSDLNPYVMITPVMRYGNIEIPVRTKRQIYAIDKSGNHFIVERNDDAEIRFTAMLLRQHPDFTEQLENDLNHFYLHKQQLLDENWFQEVFAEWRSAGVTILGFNQLKGNKLNAHKASININVVSGHDWFQTGVDVRFGKTRASLKQLHQSVRNRSKYVELDDGTLGILPEHWLEKFDAYFRNSEISKDVLITHKSNFAAINELYDDHELSPEVKQELLRYEQQFKTVQAIDHTIVPDGLTTELRDYQKQGLQWLNLLDEFNFGGCLADDMGLGKTIQVIAFMLSQRKRAKQNTNLVVMPTSLLFNWQEELQRVAPSLSVYIFYGADKRIEPEEMKQYEVILTTYGTVLSTINSLQHFNFNYVFLDESQHIKNIHSQRYLAVRKLRSRNRIAITGTPIENNTFDLFAQLSFACPGLLGSSQSFRDLFSVPIDKFQSSRNAAALQKKVAPFVLRRTKKDVASELPEKTEMTVYCPMGDAQKNIYQAYERSFRDYISGITEDELSKSTMHVLKGLTTLRLICDSPLLLKDEKLYGDRSAKIDVLLEQIENNAPSHKILVFSQFVSMLDLVRKELDERSVPYAYLTGKTQNREAQVKRFQEDENVRVFLISLKAGGTGLNLTSADYVYIVDPWWNPAVENQAIDRSYRIGQKKNVVAVRLICPGTLEEKILKLQDSKRNLAEHLIKTDAGLLQTLSRSAWLSLLDSDDGMKIA